MKIISFCVFKSSNRIFMNIGLFGSRSTWPITTGCNVSANAELSIQSDYNVGTAREWTFKIGSFAFRHVDSIVSCQTWRVLKALGAAGE